MALGLAFVVLSGFSNRVESAGRVAREGSGYRWIPLEGAGKGAPGFTSLGAEDTGVRFTNHLARSRFVTNQIYLNGSGVALGDVDGDGRSDVFLGGLDGANALFLNRGGFRFEDVASEAGVALPGLDVSGAAIVDVDGDRDMDLVVNTVGQGTHVLLNDGRVRFGAAPGSPYNRGRGGMSMAIADIDGDGDLDVFVGNYRTDTFRDQPGTRFRGRNVGGEMRLQSVNGRPVTEPDLVGRYTIHPSGTIEEHGEEDVFLLNEGAGRFREVGVAAEMFQEADGSPLLAPPYDWTLAAAFRDLNGDGHPDLYVCNDFSSPDELWINDGRGRFRRSARVALRHVPMFSMGVDFADLNGDGADDFLVVDMLGPTHLERHTQLGDVRPQFVAASAIETRPQYSYNQLFVNQGGGTFSEVGWFAGLAATGWTWSPVFLDVDLDGREDVLFGTGHELEMMDADIGAEAERRRKRPGMSAAEVQSLKLLFARHAVPNRVFRNAGELRFEDATASWRFGHPVISTGMALADLDGDGDSDVVLNNLNDAAMILRNDAAEPRIRVRLRGRPSNPAGIGARITVVGGPVLQSQEIAAGGRYLSSDAPERTFACGSARELQVSVRWRDGRSRTIGEVPCGVLCEIDEPDGSSEQAPGSTAQGPAPLFRIVEGGSGSAWRHVDPPFDDFSLQPLLPQRISQSGPGLCWGDWDSDGDDDLVMGSGRGGIPLLFRNTDGNLESGRPLFGVGFDRDTTGCVMRRGESGSAELLMALSSWEDGNTNGPTLVRLVQGRPEPETLLTGLVASAATLVTTDWDGDGDLDGFVAGRALPGRFPEGGESWLWHDEAGTWRWTAVGHTVAGNSAMVAGATAVDLTGDGFPELVLACEWGPIRVFENRRGKLTEYDPSVTLADGVVRGSKGGESMSLSRLTGCWSSVTPGDFDGDGRLDLVVGNVGQNDGWQLAGARPARLYYGDFDGNDAVEVLEAVYVAELGDYAPRRHRGPVLAALPFLAEVAPTHRVFGKSTIRSLLGERMRDARFVEAVTTTSVVLLNRGQSFEVHALPDEAQWAPVFGLVVADFDGDGHVDLFVGQNTSAGSGDTPRRDAGRGLVFLGEGRGVWHPLSIASTGFRIDGDMRGAASADFDRDGRMDLAVARNDAGLVVLRNVGGKPGLRIRLRGRSGNPEGIGAVVRPVSERGLGAARVVTSGGGWYSQDSRIVIASGDPLPSAVEVTWVGGKRTRTPVLPGTRELVVAEGENP